MNEQGLNWDRAFAGHEVITKHDGWDICEPPKFLGFLRERPPYIYVSNLFLGGRDWTVGSIYEKYSWSHSLNKDERQSLAEWCERKAGKGRTYSEMKDDKLRGLKVIEDD